MSLVPSLLQAIVSTDGDALVMHVGEKPYVVSPTGQVDLATRGLTFDAVNGIVNQLLPIESQRALDEFGAAQYELLPIPEFPGEHFTIVAARGGEDLWAEIRRRRVPDEDRVPMELFGPTLPEAAAAVERSDTQADAVYDDLEIPDVAHLWPGRVAEPELPPPAATPPASAIHAPTTVTHGPQSPISARLPIEAPLIPEPSAPPPAAAAARASVPPIVREPSAPPPAAAAARTSVPPIVREPSAPPPAAAAARTSVPPIVREPSAPPPAAGAARTSVPPIVQEPSAPPPAAAAARMPAPPLVREPSAPPPVAAAARTQVPPIVPEPSAPPPVAPAAARTPVPPPLMQAPSASPPVAPEPADSPVPLPIIPVPGVLLPVAPVAARIVPPPLVAVPVPVPRPPPAAQTPQPVPLTTAADAFPPAPQQPAVVLPLGRNPIRPDVPSPLAADSLAGLDRLLRLAAARGASTLYLSSAARPSVRVDGDVHSIDGAPVLGPNDVESLLLTLMPERNAEALRTGVASEWICDVPDVGRVRCLSFRDHRGPGGVFRMMPVRTITAEQLGLSREIQSLAIEPEGLVLVAGPRSSGKRTLMSGLVDLINRTRRDHVITVESEINVVHERIGSFVSQREVRGGSDEMLTVAQAALREDPDVLVLEEVRTAGLMNLALDAAASGQLVIGGFPAHNASGAVDRIIDLYPPEHRRQVQLSLAQNLRGVVAQVLLRKTTGGRVAAREVLLNTPAVRSALAEGKTSQLPLAIEGGRLYGMMPLNDALVGFVQSGAVDVREAYRRAADRAGFLALLKRQGLDTSLIEMPA
jgi:twitching motility protein PilT